MLVFFLINIKRGPLHLTSKRYESIKAYVSFLWLHINSKLVAENNTKLPNTLQCLKLEVCSGSC